MQYYRPFGTCDTPILYPVTAREEIYRVGAPVVMFHFDQEPIYAKDSLIIASGTEVSRGFRFPRILANSEKSQLKKHMCRRYDLLDWYFFYHGLAALDWYRDAIYFDHEQPISHVFTCLNHLSNGPRSYRIALIARMIESSIQNRGIVSLHATPHDIEQELIDPGSLLSTNSKDLIARHILNAPSTVPLIADRDNITGSASADFGPLEYNLRQISFLTLVTETVFFEPKLHLTEKIFQPIVCQRPFIVAAAPGNLEYLRSYGFRTFGDWIDESYDQEIDPDKRMDKIIAQLEQLCAQPTDRLRTMLEEMRPILEHNKRHFFTNFRRIIVNEMVDNFDSCIRIWNNGRVDGREIVSHLDLKSIQSLLIS